MGTTVSKTEIVFRRALNYKRACSIDSTWSIGNRIEIEIRFLETREFGITLVGRAAK